MAVHGSPQLRTDRPDQPLWPSGESVPFAPTMVNTGMRYGFLWKHILDIALR